MAARRRPSGATRKRMPGWLLLLFGLALGVSVALITQIVLKRAGAGDGIAGLFSARSSDKPAPPKKPAEAPAPKPKFDFYTVLPETETVLPRRPQSAKASKPEEGVSYVLQAGSFAGFQDADQLKARLALSGLVAHIQKVTIEGRGEYHRVRLGPYERLQDLDAADQQLRKLGMQPIRLKVKKGSA